MFSTRRRPGVGGRCGSCAGVMPQPSGSSGRYQPEPCSEPYASLRTYGGVTPAGCAQPVNGTCTNMLMPIARARPIVAAHCSYASTGKKSEPSAVIRVPSVASCTVDGADGVVIVPVVSPARYVYVVPGSRSVSVTECDVDAVLSRALHR